jgi:hypothetical protein
MRWARVWIGRQCGGLGFGLPQRNQGRRMVCLDGSDGLKADPWEAYPGHVIGWREGSIKNGSLFNHLPKICFKKV